MQPQNKKFKIELNPLTIGGMIVGAMAVILVIVTLVNLLRRNPYGEEMRIDNFGQYYGNISQDRKDMIFAQLYTAVANNTPEGIAVPTGGAAVRSETAEYDYNEETRVYYGSFIVDIASVEQSYWVQFEWSPVQDNKTMSGYPVLVTCAPEDLWIYENSAGCRDAMSGSVGWEHIYQWNYVLGGQSSWKIREALEGIIIRDNPLVSYVASIDEASLKKVDVGNDIGYQSEVVVDEETRYRVVMRTDETNSVRYIAVYVTEVGDEASEGIVLIDSRLGEGERTELKNTLSGWLKAISGKSGLEIEYRVEELSV